MQHFELFGIELTRLYAVILLLTSAINIIIRQVIGYGAGKLQDVTPLVLVNHFILRTFKEVVELPKEGPVFAKQQLQHGLCRVYVHAALVFVLLN